MKKAEAERLLQKYIESITYDPGRHATKLVWERYIDELDKLKHRILKSMTGGEYENSNLY